MDDTGARGRLFRGHWRGAGRGGDVKGEM